jgi:hypothetical protein
MAQQNLNRNEQEAFIPPYYMLILALVGLAVALIVALTQPTFTVVGWGGLGIMILSLVAWVVMAPDQAKAVLTGRTARYGGTSVLVTVIFLIALVGIYAVVRGANWRADLTQADAYSLTEAARQAVSGMGADPKMPKVKIIGFYGPDQASTRDQLTLLFDDYAKTSGNKISYEFINPDKNPALVTQYKVTRGGQLAVVPLNDKGEPDVAKAQLVDVADQESLTNAILKVAAQGNFRAFFLKVDGGLQLTDTGANGLSQLNNVLMNQYDWKTYETTLLELTSPKSELKLKDTGVDGDVVVIPGGTKPLSDDEIKILSDYLDKGGSLVIFAAPSIAQAGDATVSAATSLALDDKLSKLLWDKFGLRFKNDLVLDQTQAFQAASIPLATDFSRTSLITSRLTSRDVMLFELPHSIEVAPTLPKDVTVDQLVKSSSAAYAKTDMQAVIDGKADQADSDPKGPFVLAASAENSATKARVVLFGSTTIPENTWAASGTGVGNFSAAALGLAWGARYDSFVNTITVAPTFRVQDTPVFANNQTLQNISLLTIFVLPFGVLLIGGLVWWNNRERSPRS